MSTDDKRVLVEMAHVMFLLIHTKCEIAVLESKQQGVPKYLYQQAQELQDRIIQDIFED